MVTLRNLIPVSARLRSVTKVLVEAASHPRGAAREALLSLVARLYSYNA
jgi:hypothetical protein